MAIYWSNKQRGFFDDGIHAKLPSDAKKISDDRYRELLDAQSAGKEIVAGARGMPDVQDRVVPAPTLAQIQARLTVVVQRHMDAQAQSMGYDNIFTAATYAEEPAVPSFQAEGTALRAWRSEVWGTCFALLAEVNSGSRAVPSEAELIAALPAFVLPA